MKSIITIQHAQSEQHINGMTGSWTDWDLTSLGVEQARRIGERLAGEIKGRRYMMYASDLKRCRRTAQIVAERLDVAPIFTEALREFNFGEACGKSKEWARLNAGTAAFPEWITIDERPFAGAESKRDVWERLAGFVSVIMASQEENIIIVSHSGTLGLFYAMWMGMDVEMLTCADFHSSAGGVSLMCEDRWGRRVMTRFNDLSYSAYTDYRQ